MSTPNSGRFVSRLTRETLAVILAGGRGSRLHQLTDWRAKPAVHFGGKFRIIDFPLSNCVNSGIRRISVLTQYKSHSLDRHVQRGWGFLGGELGEFVELLPAQQRLNESWYIGTADAVAQNIDIIRRHDPEYVLILAGDHVYKMDYGPMIAAHVERGADITVGCIEVPIESAHAFGVMAIDDNYRVVEFEEKPENPKPLATAPNKALASMGIYVFNTRVLFRELLNDKDNTDSSHDFGKDIIPSMIKNKKVNAFPFKDPVTNGEAYWRDVGTVDSLWEANLELTGISPELDLYDDEWPIWTHQEQVPPAKFVFNEEHRRGAAIDSLIAGGSIISGSTIQHSLLFPRVRVHSYCEIEDSVLFPSVEVGRNCKIKKALIDRKCSIPDNTIIGYDVDEDRKRFYVSPKGVVLVTPSMLGQEGVNG
jgi:glucose-1-phosphate adenylyltransferase